MMQRLAFGVRDMPGALLLPDDLSPRTDAAVCAVH